MKVNSYFDELDEALQLNDENSCFSENHPVFYLPCGDIHVCKGASCPHVELTYEKFYVCSLSGHCCGALSVREDFSTGRQVGSSNPDDRGGLPIGGQWAKKVDMASMSSAAYIGASSFDDELLDQESAEKTSIARAQTGSDESPTLPTSTETQSPNHTKHATPIKKGLKVKRGARCVDEHDDDLPRRKRCSNITVDFERQSHLKQDVINTLCKLVNFEKKDAKSSKPRDARLQDRGFVTTVALKKYVKECLSAGTSPNLDEVHNICISAANLASDEKKRQAAIASRQEPLILKVRMRESISALVVSLWASSLQTPYMQKQRRGADSFRPFCVGLCYALKRGVSLADGTVVLPQCAALASSLPTLRSAAPNSTAKALHASSHRGLCTFHRCISSCSPEQAHELYDAAVQIAATLQRDVAAGRYGL